MKKRTIEWVKAAPLHKVCLALAEDYVQNKTKPDGALLAHLVKRLVKAEVRPGGPYYSEDGSVDFLTNLAVGYLFTSLKKPLPSVDIFIKSHRPQKLSPTTLAILKKYEKLYTFLPPANPHNKSHQAIFATVEKQLSRLDEPLRLHSLSFLSRVQHADKNQEIALLPRFFYDSLTSPFVVPPLAQLGEANIYCWIAYTIYDHIIDGEQITEYLPVANLAMRLALARYQALFPPNHPFQQQVQHTFNTMDWANSWEMAHCRFPQNSKYITIPALPTYGRYQLLAHRSFGHVLGPLALAHLAGVQASAIKNIEKGFEHYLIARQLNDDLHDWQQDISAGQASAVVTHILKHLQIQPGTYELEPLITQMQTDFWQHSMKAINSIVRRHLQLCRQHFLKSGVVKNEGELFALISHLEAIATQSNLEHQRSQTFATTYRQLS